MRRPTMTDMGTVLQLVRVLDSRPAVPLLPGISLRPYCGPEDVETWLAIRRKSFARQSLGVRDWDSADFQAEILGKSWWEPERMWFAVATGPLAVARPEMGTVTLGLRGSGPSAKSVIHWLAVLPAYRRRGIARLLVRHLESLVWDSGGRAVYLETHTAWREAHAFYQSLGYLPAGTDLNH